MIKRFLEWCLSKFDNKEKVEAWPFPVGHEPQLVEKPKRKPCVAKATTRPKKPVAKKTTKKAK